jgi:AcrR family transcriptional regulator
MPPPSQQERARTTQAALIAAGRALFAERGYEDVPADEIVREAGVTRGALYHHFEHKRALFEAVFEQLEAEMTAEVAEVLAASTPDKLVPAALGAFLDICTRPEVLQIALTDAPAVLGWAEWRAIEARHGLALVRAGVELMTADRADKPPAELTAQLVLSAVIEAALVIAHSPNRTQARAEAEQALNALLEGLLRAD